MKKKEESQEEQIMMILNDCPTYVGHHCPWRENMTQYKFTHGVRGSPTVDTHQRESRLLPPSLMWRGSPGTELVKVCTSAPSYWNVFTFKNIMKEHLWVLSNHLSRDKPKTIFPNMSLSKSSWTILIKWIVSPSKTCTLKCKICKFHI